MNETIPNRVELNNGGYLLFDYHQGQFRIAIYVRKVSKDSNLTSALARALQKSAFSKEVTEIASYINSVEKHESISL
jgi:hypothetical protein